MAYHKMYVIVVVQKLWPTLFNRHTQIGKLQPGQKLPVQHLSPFNLLSIHPLANVIIIYFTFTSLAYLKAAATVRIFA